MLLRRCVPSDKCGGPRSYVCLITKRFLQLRISGGGIRGTSKVMRCASFGGCSNLGPRTSQRRSVPNERPPNTVGTGRTCNAFSGLYSQAGQHLARHGEHGPEWDSRILASMHELSQRSLVPSCSSMDQNHHSWEGATAIAA